jgi:hypothetical protein
MVGAADSQVQDGPPDAPFTWSARKLALMELRDHVPWPRFRLQGEIRHVGGTDSEVGVYLGRRKVATPRGSRHHFLRVGYLFDMKERLVNANMALLAISEGERRMAAMSHSTEVRLFPSSAGLSNEANWPQLRVDALESEINIYWNGELFGTASLAELRAPPAGVDEAPTPWQLNLQDGLGLYLHDGVASFRRFTITPLD